MTEKTIRVMVVDDTVTYRMIVAGVLSDLPNVEVIGTAPNGKIALDKIERLAPDLIILDLVMPELDGLGVLRHLREIDSPVRVIMLSSATDHSAKATVEALNLGALDFVLKPTLATTEENVAEIRLKLGEKIEGISRVDSPQPRAVVRDKPRRTANLEHPRGLTERQPPEVIALGISTGGPAALTQLLPKLPADLAAPLLIVQHMPALFTKSMAEDLDQICPLSVREAVDGQYVYPGLVLLAPGGRQMKLDRSGTGVVTRITDDPPENSCRPSVDYLFRSVAEMYGPAALGVIMTGMGDDGVKGCRMMKERGATIIAQDEASCVVFGMPRQVVEERIANVVTPLDHMSDHILRYAGRGVTAQCK